MCSEHYGFRVVRFPPNYASVVHRLERLIVNQVSRVQLPVGAPKWYRHLTSIVKVFQNVFMRNKYTKELLEDVIKKCKNWAEVCRIIGVKPMTGAQTHVKKRATDFGLDYSHFLGSASNKGRIFGPKRELSDYLSNSFSISSHTLRLRLIKEGIKKPICESCGISSWMDKTPPLELDHVNGDHFDNSLENLMILCANCHTLKTRSSMPLYSN